MPATVVKLLPDKCRKCESEDIALYQLKNKDYICRACKKSEMRAKYLENRDRYIDTAKKQYRTKEKAFGTIGWARQTLAGFRYFDKKKEKTTICDLNVDELLSFTKQPCFYCGDSLDRINVDRVDNTIGHTKGNLVPSCYCCNSVRMEKWSHEEMKIIGQAIALVKAGRRKV